MNVAGGQIVIVHGGRDAALLTNEAVQRDCIVGANQRVVARLWGSEVSDNLEQEINDFAVAGIHVL